MKLGLGLKLGQTKSVTDTLPYSTEVNAAIAYGDTQGWTRLDTAYYTLIDTAIQQFISDGIWVKLDRVGFHVGNADYSRLNWKSPGNNTASLIGTPVFTVNKGINSNGGNNGYDLNYNPTVEATNYTLNNASFGVWQYEVAQNLGASQFAMGAFAAATSHCSMQVSNGAYTSTDCRINQTSATSTSGNQLISGLLHVDRANDTTTKVFRNGAQVDSETDNATALPNLKFYLCGLNNEGFSSPYIGNITFSWIGGSLEGLETEFYNTLNTFVVGLPA